MDDRDELIRRRAYAIWENEGRPDGDDRRHWEQASREMAERDHPFSAETAQGEREEDQPGTIVTPSNAPRRNTRRMVEEPSRR